MTGVVSLTPAAGPGCLADPFSVDGLRRLAREDRAWRRRLRESRDQPSIAHLLQQARSQCAPLRAVLLRHCHDLFGGLGQTGIEVTYKARQLLRHVSSVAGDVEVDGCGLDRKWLRELLTEGDEATGRPKMSTARASRALRLVTAAVDEWSLAQNVGVLWAPLSPAQARAARPPRSSLPIKVCARLIGAARPGERVKLALAVGAGLTPGEIDRLRGGDLRVQAVPQRLAVQAAVPPGLRPLWVRARGRRGKGMRWGPLPAWVGNLVHAVPPVPARASLFPPDTPSLAAIASRLGADVGHPDLAPTDLCLSWQALALAHGLRRDVVRRTWGQRRDAAWPRVWHPAQLNLLWFAYQWPVLNGEIARHLWERSVTVPRRAPAGCPADEPERGWKARKRAPAPMPPGVFR